MQDWSDFIYLSTPAQAYSIVLALHKRSWLLNCLLTSSYKHQRRLIRSTNTIEWQLNFRVAKFSTSVSTLVKKSATTNKNYLILGVVEFFKKNHTLKKSCDSAEMLLYLSVTLRKVQKSCFCCKWKVSAAFVSSSPLFYVRSVLPKLLSAQPE